MPRDYLENYYFLGTSKTFHDKRGTHGELKGRKSLEITTNENKILQIFSILPAF